MPAWVQQLVPASLAAAAVAAVHLAAAEPSWALLNSPNARIPRTAEAALRRWEEGLSWVLCCSAPRAGLSCNNTRCHHHNPRTNATHRSIPAFNPDVAAMQKKLEDVAFLLRIPQ
jgi:hypothetical protein